MNFPKLWIAGLSAAGQGVRHPPERQYPRSASRAFRGSLFGNPISARDIRPESGAPSKATSELCRRSVARDLSNFGDYTPAARAMQIQPTKNQKVARSAQALEPIIRQRRTGGEVGGAEAA